MRRILAVSVVLAASLASACVHGGPRSGGVDPAHADIGVAENGAAIAGLAPAAPQAMALPLDIPGSGPIIHVAATSGAINGAVLGGGPIHGPGNLLPDFWVAPRN